MPIVDLQRVRIERASARLDRLERELRATAIYESFPAGIASMMFVGARGRRFVVDPRLSDRELAAAVTLCALEIYAGRSYRVIEDKELAAAIAL